MRFRDKDGNVFVDIVTAAKVYCVGRDCEKCGIKDTVIGPDCYKWAHENLAEAARLMGYEVIVEEAVSDGHDCVELGWVRRDWDTCVDALNTWGGDAQTLMVFEEMAELQKELCKHARGAENRLAIAEEIADVRIMLDQMAIFHGCEEEAHKFEADKLARLRKRIEEARAGREERG